MGECEFAERLEPELFKIWSKRQDQITMAREGVYEGIANWNGLNRSSQTINYNI